LSDACGCLGFINRQLRLDPHYLPLGDAGVTPADTSEDKQPFLNVLVADFTTLSTLDVSPVPANPVADISTVGSTATDSPVIGTPATGTPSTALRAALAIGQDERDMLEHRAVQSIALAIMERLPRDDMQKQMLIDAGYLLSQQMSWDVVAREQLLPSLSQ
jgi:hypothetical protein